MSWLIAAYGAVVIAVGLYSIRLARLRRALNAEIDAVRRRR
jgi:CcmD family protein